MDTGKALLGILAGLAAGAVLGFLLAPEKGGSRKSISKKGEDLADALNNKIDEKIDDLIRSLAGKVIQENKK